MTDDPTGRDLDARIAETVFGWRTLRLGGDWWGGVDETVRIVPPFSTDLAAAWSVVEHLREQQWCVALAAIPSGWSVYFYFYGASRPTLNTTGADAPCVICRAALAALKEPHA